METSTHNLPWWFDVPPRSPDPDPRLADGRRNGVGLAGTQQRWELQMRLDCFVDGAIEG